MSARTVEILAGTAKSQDTETVTAPHSRVMKGAGLKADKEGDIHQHPETETKRESKEKTLQQIRKRKETINQKTIVQPPKILKIMSHQKPTLKGVKLKKNPLKKEKEKRKKEGDQED